MLGLQVSIGALNDLVDAPRDTGLKPGKPIPRGAASARDARTLSGAGLLVGLLLATPSGPGSVAVSVACVACGYAYDLRLSRGPWSWLPLAIALPLVPIYAWVGVTGTVPTMLLPLIPIGVLAGAGLSIANGLADLERDLVAGSDSIAVRLGRRRAWAAHATLLVAAIALAVLFRAVWPATAASQGFPVALGGAGLGAAAILAGIGSGGGGGPLRRERAWELEALGVAILGAGWIAATVAT